MQILPSIGNVDEIPKLDNSKSSLLSPVAVKFGEKSAVHDITHIKQHLKEKIDINKVSLDRDLETFHYFRMHDLNKDGKIDGVELIKGLTHIHEEMSENKGEKISEADLEDMVSITLKNLDIDDDGYITYAEYRRVKRN
ncbi:Multiple coagulation factor deficiency protein [Dirofilaria immitis]